MKLKLLLVMASRKAEKNTSARFMARLSHGGICQVCGGGRQMPAGVASGGCTPSKKASRPSAAKKQHANINAALLPMSALSFPIVACIFLCLRVA